MFENYLLNKYSKYVEEFVYEIEYLGWHSFNIKTYFVLRKNDKLKFIKYKIYKDLSEKEKEKAILDLQKIGYESLESVVMRENEKNNKRNLFKV